VPTITTATEAVTVIAGTAAIGAVVVTIIIDIKSLDRSIA
jgi:hypothetical protein